MPALKRNIQTLGDRCEWALLSYNGKVVADQWRAYLAALPEESGPIASRVTDFDSLVSLRPKTTKLKFLSKWAMLSETVIRFLDDYDRILVRTCFRPLPPSTSIICHVGSSLVRLLVETPARGR